MAKESKKPQVDIAGYESVEEEAAAPAVAQAKPAPAKAPVSAPAPTPAPAAPAPKPQQLSLLDAARRLVPGFKEHWWPGIQAHAKGMGFGKTGTLEQCKAVLRSWGAKI